MKYTWFFFVEALGEDVFSPLQSKLKLKEEEDALKSKEEDADSFKQMI